MEDDSALNSAVAQLFGLDSASALFVQAVTHPSFSHESPEAPHNQRLEFLGDAVLDFVVSEVLYERFPSSDEGLLTRTRSQLVSTGALARFARVHGVGKVLRFGRGAAQGNLGESDNVLADAVEALIAAAYLDVGMVAARLACVSVLEHGLREISEAGARDAKSELQEKVQALGLPAPTYRVTQVQGPAHDAVFEVHVHVRGCFLATGTGRSKRVAERQAAERALQSDTYRSIGQETDKGGGGCSSEEDS